MNEYTVSIPMTAIVVRIIYAESEEQAIEQALQDTTLNIGSAQRETDGDIEGWELHDKIVGGNVFYGMQNEIVVEDNGPVED